MNRTALLALSALCLVSTLCACAPFNPTKGGRAGVCNELNSQLIFNGATSNTRQAEIENSQLPLAQHNYDKRCE